MKKNILKIALIIISLSVLALCISLPASAEGLTEKAVNSGEEIDLGFDVSNMLASLQYMWKGMLCIFVVIGVIILSVYLMNFIGARAAEIKQMKEEEKE